MSYAKRAAPVLALAAVLIFWEAAVRLFQIPLYVLPSPTEVLNALISDRLTLFSHSVITVAEALLGMGISLVLAVVLPPLRWLQRFFSLCRPLSAFLHTAF